MYTATSLLLSLAIHAPAREADASAIYQKASKATVRIETDEAAGTGFVTGDGSMVITCYHVIEDGTTIKVEDAGAKLVAFDKEADVAVLKLGKKRANKLVVSQSAAPKPGTKVYVLGNPLGLEKSITDGMVSAIRKHGNLAILQFTAPISSGSSGSPVMDSKGVVVGMAMSSIEEGQGINLAISAFNIRNAIAKVGKAPVKPTTKPPAKQPVEEPEDLFKIVLRRATPSEISRMIAKLSSNEYMPDEDVHLTEEAIEPFADLVKAGKVGFVKQLTLGHYFALHIEKAKPKLIQMLRGTEDERHVAAISIGSAAIKARNPDRLKEDPGLKPALTDRELIDALADSVSGRHIAFWALNGLADIETAFPGLAREPLAVLWIRLLKDGNPEYPPLIVDSMAQVLKASDAGVMIEAIKFAAKHRSPRDDEETALSKCFEALKQGRSPACTRVALDALTWEQEAARMLGCTVLRYRGESAIARKELGALLNDPAPRVRGEALIALAEVSKTGYLDVMERFMSSTDPWVRAAGVKAVHFAGAAKFKQQVLRLSKDSDPRVRQSATYPLSNVCGAEGKQRLRQMAVSDPDEDVRRAASNWVS